MDPIFIGSDWWAELGGLLTSFWVFLAFVVGFAFNVLLARAVLPSLVATKHLPEKVLRSRPAFYIAALASLALAAFFFFRVAQAAFIAERIYPRWWM